MGKQILKSGWGKADITPEKKTLLRGQDFRRISTHTNDPLYATALALKDQKGELIIWISFDLVGILKDEKDILSKEVVKAIPEVKEENVICSCIHNHTGPFLNSRKFRKNKGGDLSVRIEVPDDCLKPEEYFYEALIPKTVTACKEAFENLSPTGFSSVSGHAVVGHCRRILMRDGTAIMYGKPDNYNFDRLESSSDHGVEMMYMFDSNKKLNGLILNVNCPAQVVELKSYFSADFIGIFRNLIKEELGYELPVLSLIGASGNISPRDLIRQGRAEPDMWELEGAIEIAGRLKKCFLENLRVAEDRIEFEAKFGHLYKEVSLPIFKVTQGEITKAKKDHDRLLQKYDEKIFNMNAEDMKNYKIAKGTMDREALQNKNSLYDSPVHAVRIGDSAFITNPFELFIEYGMRIRARANAAHTFTAQLTDDTGGYLPTKEAIMAGGFSAVASHCVAGYEGGEILTETSINMINELFGN